MANYGVAETVSSKSSQQSDAKSQIQISGKILSSWSLMAPHTREISLSAYSNCKLTSVHPTLWLSWLTRSHAKARNTWKNGWTRSVAERVKVSWLRTLNLHMSIEEATVCWKWSDSKMQKRLWSGTNVVLAAVLICVALSWSGRKMAPSLRLAQASMIARDVSRLRKGLWSLLSFRAGLTQASLDSRFSLGYTQACE